MDEIIYTVCCSSILYSHPWDSSFHFSPIQFHHCTFVYLVTNMTSCLNYDLNQSCYSKLLFFLVIYSSNLLLEFCVFFSEFPIYCFYHFPSCLHVTSSYVNIHCYRHSFAKIINSFAVLPLHNHFSDLRGFTEPLSQENSVKTME